MTDDAARHVEAAAAAPPERAFAELLPSGFVPTDREPRSVGLRLLHALRALVAGLLAVAVAVVAAASVVGLWVRDEVLDTAAYTAAVAPVATAPAVQDDVARRVWDAVLVEVARAGVPAGVREELDPPVRAAAVELVRRPEFAAVWVQANRAGHEQVVRLLRGDDRPVPGASVVDGRLLVDLTAAVDPVRAQIQERLDRAVAAAGLPVTAPRLPRTELVVDAGDVSDAERARPWVARSDRAARSGPAVAAGLAVLALVVARRRLRMLAVVAFAVVVAMVAVRVGLHVGTTEALDRLAAARVPPDVGALVVERLTSVLRDTTRWVGIGASAVLAVAGVGAVAAANRRERRTALPEALRPSPDDAVPS